MSLSYIIIAISLIILPICVYKYQDRLSRWLAKSYKRVRFYFPTEKKVVALTIDDVPRKKSIGPILSVLDKYNAKATFFVIGSYVNKISDGQEIIKTIKQKHELGNHTMTNMRSIKLSPEQLEKEIKQVEEIAGKMSYFRPGSGFFNDKMIDIVNRLGYTLVLGDVYPHDPLFRLGCFAKMNAKYILDRIKPGSIIILHDLDVTVGTLEIILPELKARGYEVTTLSELEKMTKN